MILFIFATKMLPNKDLRSQDFEWTDQHNKRFGVSNNNELSVITDASEQAIGGDLSQEGHPVIYVSRKLSSAEELASARITRSASALMVFDHKLKKVPGE